LESQEELTLTLAIDEGSPYSGLVFSDNVYPEMLDFETLGTVQFEWLVSPKHVLAQIDAAQVDILKLHRQLVIGSQGSKVTWFNQAHSPDVWYADNDYVLLELAGKCGCYPAQRHGNLS